MRTGLDNWLAKKKLEFFSQKKIPLDRQRGILRETGFVKGKFPMKYLGVLIISGRLFARHLKVLVNRVRDKICGWKMKFLSNGGRLILLRHVLSSMPIHLLSVI